MLECDEPQTTSSRVGSKPAQRLGGLVGEVAVFGGRLVADLPGAVHLVAETPEAAVPRFRASVLGPEVRPVAAAGVVDVFDEGPRLVEAAGTEIDRQHHLGAGLFGPVGEFVNADLVRLRGAPGKIEPPRAVLLWADAILPIVGGHEVAARIAADRRVERAHQFEHVLAHALRVRLRMSGLVDARVDRPAKMLEKRAVETFVDIRDGIGRVRRDSGFHDPSHCGL